jgi:adenylosuccinate lyase
VIPEAFLATDAILILMTNIAGGLQVHPERIRQRVHQELPFMATERLLVRAVEAGGDRQAVHEIIRRNSMLAARALKEGAGRNDLLERVASEPGIGLSRETIESMSDPGQYTGRAAQQVDEFLTEVVGPALAGAEPAQDEDSELRV